MLSDRGGPYPHSFLPLHFWLDKGLVTRRVKKFPMILCAAWLPRSICNASGNGGGILLGYMPMVSCCQLKTYQISLYLWWQDWGPSPSEWSRSSRDLGIRSVQTRNLSKSSFPGFCNCGKTLTTRRSPSLQWWYHKGSSTWSSHCITGRRRIFILLRLSSRNCKPSMPQMPGTQIWTSSGDKVLWHPDIWDHALCHWTRFPGDLKKWQRENSPGLWIA